MKKYMTVFISLFLFFSLTAYANEYKSVKGTALIIADSLNVRSGPSKEHGKIGSLKRDIMVQVIGIVEPDWYVIEYGGKEGYIHQDYVVFTPVENAIEDEEYNEHKGDGQRTDYLLICVIVAIGMIIVAMILTLFKLKSEEEEEGCREEGIPLAIREDVNMHLGEVSYDTYRLDIDPVYFEDTTIIPQPGSLLEEDYNKESWKADVNSGKEIAVGDGNSVQTLDSKLEEATAQIAALKKEVEELKKHKR